MTKHHRAEDWLTVLHWGLGLILSPSPARILESFEAYEHRHRLRSGFRQLRRAGWLAVSGRGRDRVLQLTPSGACRARGNADPIEQWGRSWDGRWRMLLFDLPSRSHSQRQRLWRWLRNERLGYLQNSVWISPHPIRSPIQTELGQRVPAESMVVVLATPDEANRDQDIAASAWDFESLNRRYEECLELLDQGAGLLAIGRRANVQLRGWLARERAAWSAALEEDPLLPRCLYPRGYVGETAYRRREELYRQLARTLLLRSEVPPTLKPGSTANKTPRPVSRWTGAAGGVEGEPSPAAHKA